MNPTRADGIPGSILAALDLQGNLPPDLSDWVAQWMNGARAAPFYVKTVSGVDLYQQLRAGRYSPAFAGASKS